MFAAPFVVDGEHGTVEIETCGIRHQIEIALDRIAQQPKIQHTTTPTESVKSGTSVKVHWNQVASSQTRGSLDFYRSGSSLSGILTQLIADYSAFNPHATFSFNGTHRAASQPDWKKWRTDAPTSAHWYRPADLRALIAAFIHESDRPLRDFVAEFAGLSGTQVRKTVLAEAAISARHLSELVQDGDVEMGAVDRLLGAMCRHSKPVEPKRLGVIGKNHLEQFFTAEGAQGFQYRKIARFDEDGLPYVLEIGFGVMPHNTTARRLIVGLNWAPVFKIPSGEIANALNDCRCQLSDPVMLLISGAASLQLHRSRQGGVGRMNLRGALADSLRAVTREFTAQKRKAAAAGRDTISASQYARLLKNKRTISN